MADKEDNGQESIEETLKRLLGSFPNREKPMEEEAGAPETLDTPFSEAGEEQKPPPEWAGVLETLAAPFPEAVEEDYSDVAPPLPPVPEPPIASTGVIEPAPEMVAESSGVATEAEASPLPFAPQMAPPPPAAPQTPVSPPPPPTMFEGVVELKIAIPTDTQRVSEMERGLKTNKDLRWLGTWGSSRQGIVIQIEPVRALALIELLNQMPPVQKVEIPKKVKDLTKLLVTLGEKIPTEAAPSKADVNPSPATSTTSSVSPVSSPSPPGTVQKGPIKLEVSPLTSLGELTRFEQMLSRLGRRPASIVTVGETSGVLFTLEDTSRKAVIDLLRGLVPDAILEETPDKIKAQLPARW